MDRRRFLEVSAMAAAGASLGCSALGTDSDVDTTHDGRLRTTWRPPTSPLAPGEHALGLDAGARDGFIRIPEGLDPEVPAPLALLLHGAGQNAHEWDGGFPLFDELGLVVLSVDSRAASWDVRYGGFGPDVVFIDQALARVFAAWTIDPTRIAVAGFSDGASYALSLGLINGDLFTRILGFSPGFVRRGEARGEPAVFLSHGTSDRILPVAFTRALAEDLRAEGHAVVYEEFAGGHTVPYEIARQGFGWFVRSA